MSMSEPTPEVPVLPTPPQKKVRNPDGETEVVVNLLRKELESMKFITGVNKGSIALLACARKGMRYMYKYERALDNAAGIVDAKVTAAVVPPPQPNA